MDNTHDVEEEKRRRIKQTNERQKKNKESGLLIRVTRDNYYIPRMFKLNEMNIIKRIVFVFFFGSNIFNLISIIYSLMRMNAV